MTSLAIGDRVEGNLGVGTIVGGPLNPANTRTHVLVQWDIGCKLDTDLRSLAKAANGGAAARTAAAPSGRAAGPPEYSSLTNVGSGRAAAPPEYSSLTNVGSSTGGYAQANPAARAAPATAGARPQPSASLLPPAPSGNASKKRSSIGTMDQGAPNPLDLLWTHSQTADAGGTLSHKVAADTHARRRNSQLDFAERSQTCIVFDWDDTLFPTNYIIHELRLDHTKTLAEQAWVSQAAAQEVTSKLGQCEAHALELLQRSSLRGHVALVTLAKDDWVHRCCRLWYPSVGEYIRSVNMPVLYAQDRLTDQQKADVWERTRGNDEEYYGTVKGRAIGEEIERCYSQYEGQTWKNVVSIGDSRFERYGLMAASTAYMTGRRLSSQFVHPSLPTQQGAWTGVANDKEVRLRVKVCKLVEQPDMDELVVELHLISRWLDLMVKLNEGFDMDIEALSDNAKVQLAEAVLRGQRPVAQLPRVA